jgi:hypothetical protein
MTSDLPETIELYETIPEWLGSQAAIGGDSRLDDQGRLEVRLAIKDDSGERTIRRNEGDAFEFAGATWQVTTLFGPSMGGRSRVAVLSRIE